MVKQRNDLLAFLGWRIQGDLGPWTFYTSARGSIVWYERTPALNPPSAIQQVMRDRWRIAAQAWHSLDQETKARWELASQRANLHITGYNLWVYWRTTQDRTSVETVARQSGLTLLP